MTLARGAERDGGESCISTRNESQLPKVLTWIDPDPKITIFLHRQVDLLRIGGGVSRNIINIVGAPESGKTQFLQEFSAQAKTKKGLSVVDLDFAAMTTATNVFETACALAGFTPETKPTQPDNGAEEKWADLALSFRDNLDKQKHPTILLVDNVPSMPAESPVGKLFQDVLIYPCEDSINAMCVVAGDTETRWARFELRKHTELINLPPLSVDQLQKFGIPQIIYQMTGGLPGLINAALSTVEGSARMAAVKNRLDEIILKNYKAKTKDAWSEEQILGVFYTMASLDQFDLTDLAKAANINATEALQLCGAMIETDLVNWNFDKRGWAIIPPFRQALAYQTNGEKLSFFAKQVKSRARKISEAEGRA